MSTFSALKLTLIIAQGAITKQQELGLVSRDAVETSGFLLWERYLVPQKWQACMDILPTISNYP